MNLYEFSVHFIRATVFIYSKSFFQVRIRQHRRMFLYEKRIDKFLVLHASRFFTFSILQSNMEELEAKVP